MKRVLQDLKTELFFKNMDEWTPLVDEAADFRDALAALRFCEKINLTNIAVLLTNQNGSPHRLLAFRRALPSSRKTSSISRQAAAA